MFYLAFSCPVVGLFSGNYFVHSESYHSDSSAQKRVGKNGCVTAQRDIPCHGVNQPVALEET